ncbi:MAG TPA: GNAT family N-acetyltransferase, partial [Symbiobacteriaceae bacterium]|nr:GNAT family N-acetyltransferase [Symbiobacteriaceae bacterium]
EVSTMQPTVRLTALDERQRAAIMEDVIMAVRQLWFSAAVIPLGRAVGVQESGGEMIMAVDEDGPGADGLIAAAAKRGAYVVATDYSRPPDLGARLRLAGYSAVQAHRTYLLDEEAFAAATEAGPRETRRQGLLTMLWRRDRLPVEVHRITEAELPHWNAVCWRAFGARTSEGVSLLDKQIAFRNMGASARWYLATAGGRPAGTAIVFQGEEAAQVLAVGTLPSLQGRGIATAVMKQIIREWQAEGHGFLFLDTSPGSSAEKLYLKLGFVPAYLREVYAPGRPLP